MTRLLVDVRAAAEMLSCSVGAMRQMLDDPDVPLTKVKRGKSVRVSVAEIEDYVASLVADAKSA